jgi:hypothetical protein
LSTKARKDGLSTTIEVSNHNPGNQPKKVYSAYNCFKKLRFEGEFSLSTKVYWVKQKFRLTSKEELQ